VPYRVKNISPYVVAIPLEGIQSIYLLPGKQFDLTSCCTNEWILRDATIARLISENLLAVTLDNISGTSPYFEAISEDTAGNVTMTDSLTVGEDLTVGDDVTIGDDILSVDDVHMLGELTSTIHDITTGVVKKTTEAITLYVRTTGDDNNDGDVITAPLATIQEAVNRIPKFVLHDVTIDLGEGSFTGAVVKNIIVSGSAKFLIKGILGAVTPATGTASGTATAGTTLQLTDSGQTWTANNLRGKLLKVDNAYRFIRQNTADVIDVVGPFSESVDGKDYEIVESKTTITSSGEYGALYYSACKQALRNSFEIQDVNITTGILCGVFAYVGDPPYLTRVSQSNGTYYGVAFQVCSGEWGCEDLWLENNAYDGLLMSANSTIVGNTRAKRIMVCNNGQHGITLDGSRGPFLEYVYAIDNGACGAYLSYCYGIVSFYNYFHAEGNTQQGVSTWDVPSLDFGEVYIYNNTTDGIRLQNTGMTDIDSGTISNNGGYGVVVDNDGSLSGNRSSGSFLNMVGTITVANNGDSGIAGLYRSSIAITNCDGTGNAGYGVNLKAYSYCTITSASGITGASGDATINDGGVALSWATDFANDGDIAINLENGCRVERKD
jgi:hypothetical protein